MTTPALMAYSAPIQFNGIHLAIVFGVGLLCLAAGFALGWLYRDEDADREGE